MTCPLLSTVSSWDVASCSFSFWRRSEAHDETANCFLFNRLLDDQRGKEFGYIHTADQNQPKSDFLPLCDPYLIDFLTDWMEKIRYVFIQIWPSFFQYVVLNQWPQSDYSCLISSDLHHWGGGEQICPSIYTSLDVRNYKFTSCSSPGLQLQ